MSFTAPQCHPPKILYSYVIIPEIVQKKQMTHTLSKKQQILIIICFYAIFGTMYWVANSLQSNFEYNLWREAVVDYSLKALLTLPIWWFIFRFLKKKKLGFRLAFHLITCPLYVFVWFYTFRIFARNFDLFYLRDSGAVWDIYIPTLFYFLQFGFFHAYEYWENSQIQLQKEQELKETARIAEINNYKAQLQPHFLFNTLNSINATLTDNEPARELIAKLADTFRYAMQISDKEFIPLQQEIDFNKTCLELEQARFSDRLTVLFDVDDTLLQNLIPPMILQPIIENAVKHGIAKNISKGEILISVHNENEKMVFKISNTGLLIEAQNPNGIGLSNTRKRLLLLYGETLTINSEIDNRVSVQFKIPIK